MFRNTNRRAWLGGLVAISMIGPATAQTAALPPKPLPPAYADSERCPRSSIVIVNDSSDVVREIYLRSSGAINGFGEDRLGATQLLRSGERLALDPGQGVFDLLVLRVKARPAALMRFNACDIAALHVTEDDVLAVLRRRS
jgi:hypothetical protein